VAKEDTMTTGEAQRIATYESILRNLLTLKDQLRETNSVEAKAIDKIAADVVSLQLRDGYSRVHTAKNRN
jgi:hypothetical protein